MASVDISGGAGGGGTSLTLTDTHIFVGDATNTPADVALTLSATGGPFALANTGVLTMPNANATTRGLLTAADWTAFNSKPSNLYFQVACSDMTTAITAANNKAYFRAPVAFTATSVRASLFTAQTAGSIFTIDIKKNGVSILTTLITIDNNEKTSLTAAIQPVLNSSQVNIADDDIITFDVTQAGTSPAGLIVTIIG